MVEDCDLHAPVHMAQQWCTSCLPLELDAVLIPVPHSKWNLDCVSSVFYAVLWLTIVSHCNGTQRQTELVIIVFINTRCNKKNACMHTLIVIMGKILI